MLERHARVVVVLVTSVVSGEWRVESKVKLSTLTGDAVRFRLPLQTFISKVEVETSVRKEPKWKCSK